MSTVIDIQPQNASTTDAPGKISPFPLDHWYVAGFSSELTDKPLGRTYLNQKVVLFRTPDGQVSALEDRCCHKSLPLSCGSVEAGGVRCGYHGLLFNGAGQCTEIPGQERIPSKAKVRSYHARERNQIIWIWMPKQAGGAPTCEPPEYQHHDNPAYKWGSGRYHYQTPWQLIHDNLLDLSHLGYVHLKTIGGDARLHMNAPTQITTEGTRVKVVRHMADSTPPPTYKAAWPLSNTCDRWQEIEFQPSHTTIWSGAYSDNVGPLDNPDRGGLHLRGFNGITPETETTCHYFWSMCCNKHPDMPEIIDTVLQQIEFTFNEDKGVIQDQWRNMVEFGDQATWIDIHCDAGANRARRIIERLVAENSAI